MRKVISLLLALSMTVMMLSACGSTSNDSTSGSETKVVENATEEMPATSEGAATDTKYSVGFVTFGLGGDFFQALADTFVEKMTAAGWDAQYADGAFDPTTQIEACENYIAMGVDVLVIWSVAPEAMDTVVQEAMDKGIKVVSFVAPTTQYDALMVSDDAALADNCAKLAAQWIDTKYADAEDHSVPVAVFSCRTADTGVVQGNELLKIEEFSQKAKFVTEVECADENMNTGLSAMENLYSSNPEIKVFLSAHNGLALGINSYFTGVSSPVTDYSDMGIFTINGDSAVAEIVKTSAEGKSPLRGMVLTGSVDDTVADIMSVCSGVMEGSIKKGTITHAATQFVYDKTVDEYLTTGKVTSVTEKDFK